jgi:hypothetical protein
MGFDTKTDWPPDRRSSHNFNTDFELVLSQLRVADVRSEKLVAGEGERSLLDADTTQRLVKTEKTLCSSSYSELWSVRLSENVVVTSVSVY